MDDTQVDEALETRETGARNVIYILSNVAMPGLLKIGCATDLESRVEELSNFSAVPAPFKIIFAIRVQNGPKTEAAIHRAFANFRMPNKEFFAINWENIAPLMRLLSGEIIIGAETPIVPSGPIERLEPDDYDLLAVVETLATKCRSRRQARAYQLVAEMRQQGRTPTLADVRREYKNRFGEPLAKVTAHRAVKDI